jgi:predicted metal-binding membrane protein
MRDLRADAQGITVSVDATLEAVARHDRLVVVTALTAVIALSWAYLLAGAGMGMSALEMTRMSQLGVAGSMSEWGMAGMSMMTPAVWTPGYAALVFFMWWVMMVAMMLPSAAPTILLAAALNRRSTSDRPPYGTATFFTIGYLLAWFLFSLLATVGQLVLGSIGLMSSTMNSNSVTLSAGLMIAAGVWQFSPIKQACLRHCRSPVDFITRRRHPGNRGALLMGLEHGAYCLGCCWFLMALLFVGGVMNLHWIAGLAVFVLVEKIFSRGAWFGRIAGAGFIVIGAALLMA